MFFLVLFSNKVMNIILNQKLIYINLDILGCYMLRFQSADPYKFHHVLLSQASFVCLSLFQFHMFENILQEPNRSIHNEWLIQMNIIFIFMRLLNKLLNIFVPIYTLILKCQLTWTTLCITRFLHGCFANTNSSMSCFFSFCSCVGSGSSIAGL